MLGVFAKYFKDVSQVRRLLFALEFLPNDTPDRLRLALDFATRGKSEHCTITTQQLSALCENLEDIDKDAFSTSKTLLENILQHPKNKPLGVVLVSTKNVCLQCKSKLLLRRDRPASVVIYDDNMGTIPGSHFHKYCSNRRCGFTQYYGYYTEGLGEDNAAQLEARFDEDWESNAYFVSSRETAFSMKLIHRFHSQILHGQQSFKQCADVYNHLHNVLQLSSFQRQCT